MAQDRQLLSATIWIGQRVITFVLLLILAEVLSYAVSTSCHIFCDNYFFRYDLDIVAMQHVEIWKGLVVVAQSHVPSTKDSD